MNRLLILSILVPSLACAQDLPWPLSAHPNPHWGLTGSHMMYTNSAYQWNYGSGAENYRTNIYGPYTTIVTNGQTWTWPQPAGAVVQVIGPGVFNFVNNASVMKMGGEGTEALPIFFVGISPDGTTNNMPIINRPGGVFYHAKWTLIEGFACTNNTFFSGAPNAASYANPIYEVAFRSNLFYGTGVATSSGRCITASTGSGQGSDANYLSNILVYANTGARYGNYTNASQNDSCFSIFGEYCYNIWFGRNRADRFGGDTIRVGVNESDYIPDNLLTSRGFFMWENESTENGENLVDMKQARDVLWVKNLGYNIGYIGSGGGQTISAHYYPRQIFDLNNIIYGNLGNGHGFYFSGQTNNIWVVGNLGYNQAGRAAYPDRVRGDFRFHNNTFVQWGNGIISARQTDAGEIDSIQGSGNIVVDISSGIYLQIESANVRADTLWRYNNFYSTTAGAVNIDWGTTVSLASWTNANPTMVGNVSVDPGFVNPAERNYRLVESSPMRGIRLDDWQTDFRNSYSNVFGYDPGTPVDYYGNPFANDAGAYAYDDGVTAPPDAPTGVNAVANAHDDIDVSWGNVTGEDEFRVYVSTTPGNSNPTLVTTTAANVLTATFDTLSEFTPQGNTTYHFTVRACSDAGGCSALSAEDSVTTPAFVPIATTGPGRAAGKTIISRFGK